MKFSKKINISFLLLLLFSCTSSDDNFPVFAKHYKLDYTGQGEIMIKNISPNTKRGWEVYGHVLFYGYNNDFIIIQQKPRDKIVSPFNLSQKFDEQNLKIQKSNISQYWIIKIHNDSIFGPFNKAEYFFERKKLNVPDNLKLDNSTLGNYLIGQRNDIQYESPDKDVVDIVNLKNNKTTIW